MKHRPDHYATRAGARLPFGVWRSCAAGFSVRPMRRAHQLRNDTTGEVYTPPWKFSASNDTIDAHLYSGVADARLFTLLRYAFGRDATSQLWEESADA